MAAPKGHKPYSGSETGGRPIKYDLNLETEKLLEWADKDTSTTLLQFCNERETHPQRISEWEKKSEKFSEALKRTKTKIAQRLREKIHDKKNPYNYGLFMREIGNHDYFLHAYEESIKDRDFERKKKLIDYEYDKKAQANSKTYIAPNDDILTSLEEQLEENKKLKARLDALISKTDPILSGSDETI